MPALHSFDYGILRIVPCQERGEFVNAGIVMHCPESGFLECRVYLDEDRVRRLWPDLDLDLVRRHLEAFPRISAAQAGGRPNRAPLPPRTLSLAGGSAQHDSPGLAGTQRPVRRAGSDPGGTLRRLVLR